MNAGRQRIEQDLLEVRRESASQTSAVELPVRDRRLDPFTQSTPFMQSDHPKIRALAREILRGDNDGHQAVLRLKNWVYKEIAKEPTVSIPSALEVLQSRKGDCNEHTVLFNALARAAGIPAKTAVGIVYVRNAFTITPGPRSGSAGGFPWIPLSISFPPMRPTSSFSRERSIARSTFSNSSAI